MLLKNGPPVPLVRSPICHIFVSNSRIQVRHRMGYENGAKKSAGRKISQTVCTGFHSSQRSSFPFSSTLPFNPPTQVCATHAAHKRAVPTERGAQVRIIFIRHGKRRVRAIFEGRRNPKNSNRSKPRGSYLSKYSFEENVWARLRTIKRVDLVEPTYVHSPQMRNESLPEQGRIVRRSLRLSSLAGCPFFTRSLSPSACFSLLPLSLPPSGSPTPPFFSLLIPSSSFSPFNRPSCP